MSRPVVMLTDFGMRDGFVGAMKGVILKINPKATIIDLSHEVSPYNIFHGALLLRAHYSFFPEETIFLCVVDPGVGSSRLPLAIKAGKYYFVGPQNGIFDLALKSMDSPPFAFVIENYTLPSVSQTFHGRDVFAPVAGHLSKGLALEEVGRPIEYNYILEWEEPKVDEDMLVGKIIYFDNFGNCVTNIPCGAYTEAYFRGEKLGVVHHFLQGDKHKPSIICGSFGLMELFLSMDSMRQKLSVTLGESVAVRLPLRLKKSPQSTIIYL